MKKNYVFLLLLLAIFSCQKEVTKQTNYLGPVVPILKTNQSESDTIAHAFNLAIGHIYSNVRPYKENDTTAEIPTLFAGMEYYGPWTRDASINIYNGGGLLLPEISKNTLLSELTRDANGTLRIKGQYWDSPLWIIAAWQYYLYTGDKPFLKTALDVSMNHLKQLEESEFDSEKGLFRGASFFNDGISGYPDVYAKTGTYHGGEWVSGITKWVEENPSLKAKKGFGLPMMCLSTNCIYYKAYTLLDSIAKTVGTDISDFKVSDKSIKLKENINKHLWSDSLGRYRYFIDPFGGCDYQESAGLAMAVLFGVANEKQAELVFKNIHVEPAGLPCIYPSFPRYVNKEKTTYGRHSGVIWLQVVGYFALAAKSYNKTDLFYHEYHHMAHNALRDMQFLEIYHPLTGQPYGGVQESNPNGEITLWKSTEVQTWSATAYMSMTMRGMFGMEFTSNGLVFSPMVDQVYENLRLINIPYRAMILDVYITGKGSNVAKFEVNGEIRKAPFVNANETGRKLIKITLN